MIDLRSGKLKKNLLITKIHRYLIGIDTNVQKYILIDPIFFKMSVEAGSFESVSNSDLKLV